MDLYLRSSFLLLLHPNHWKTGKQELGRAAMEETHTALSLSCPGLQLQV